MKALILSTDDFEDSELLVPYYRFQEEGIDVEIASPKPGKIKGKHGYEIHVDKTLDEVTPSHYDVLVIPGGKAAQALRKEELALEIAASFLLSARVVGAICHGPQVLIATGLVRNRRLTCHHSVAKELEFAGAVYVDGEVVVDGNLITSRTPADLQAFMRAVMRAVKSL
jgi:protease I